uniref:two pore calcium channel protein 1-like isoform X1 n=1 Tax=Styela clava TaxID=7725 RepID=UPI00193AC229|nr:two pore calcium channel protein 1-like isoform X1 [Styela clava]
MSADEGRDVNEIIVDLGRNGIASGVQKATKANVDSENNCHVNTVAEEMEEINTTPEGDISIATDRQRSEEILLLAATYVEDALDGRTLPYKTDPKSIEQYRIYSNPIRRWGTVFFMWWNLCLAIFEAPAVSGAALPNWATMLMEVLCLSVFIIRFWRLSRFVPRDRLLHDPKNIVVMLTIVFTVIDMIVYIGMINSPAKDEAIRVSRIIRPLFLVNMNESRQIRRAFRNIRNTIPDILSVLVLFFFSIALFSLMAFKLFEKRGLTYRTTNEAYFVNYWDSYWDLYVLVTTANSPDVMIPAYDFSPWFAIFFITYVIVNTYIFMNLFLAVIYNSYKTHLEKEIGVAVEEKQRKLDKAFDLLKNDSLHEEPCVTYHKWIALLRIISSRISEERALVLWHVLCDNETKDGISQSSFSKSADAINVRLVIDGSDNNFFANKFPGCFYSKGSKVLIQVVNHIYFVYAFDLLILANAVCIALDLEQTEWFFLPVFMIEIALRMYAVGPREYFSLDRLWNWFDFIIISAAFIATIVEASLNELDQFPREALDVLLVLRCLRLVKIVGNIETFRIVVMTIVNITPSLLTYAGVLIMVYYSFAVIGMEAFSNKVLFNAKEQPPFCGNPKLQDSEFVRMGYCQMNFNDIIHSIVTLFVLMVVNQWHVITQGFVFVTNKAARLFFISFHLSVVILILNIIVAFVLEAFILEYTIKNNVMEDRIEEKINELRQEAESKLQAHDRTELVEATDASYVERQNSSIPGYKFRVNKGHKNIEVLLQRMFEATRSSAPQPTEEVPVPTAEVIQTISDTTQSSSNL